ncbi:sensor histidine kinase N-terminal domain-containing protein [Pulveribacter sp.]|uniref:sensor histidine kinase n=1 Tax=Pulveribacter sp. TaxID=2678893 RepID=UPI0028ABB6D2|nr:sensor histidine kinase N-terminal domain-containing protein [Pulveribacter sp.]
MPPPRERRWARWSLRRTLLAVLLPGLVLVMGLELMVSWRNDLAAANAAFDRSLLGAIKAMDANISTDDGGLSVELPYRMLEFFELTASGQVFYRVASGDGLVEIGDAGLPAPPLPLVDGRPQFHDAQFLGVPVRVGSYARQLPRPLSQGSHSDRVLIQVAETLQSRQDFTRRLLLESVARDVLLLLAALALVALAVHGALRPLSRLRAEVAARGSADLAPIDPQRVPKDVQPLVQAINLHMQRYQQVLGQQRRFIDDASHQLRTPLTTLATQVAFALRERDAARRDAALLALKEQVDGAIRQANQMLALARADAAPLDGPGAPVDLLALAEGVARQLWPLARQHGIDLGLEPLQGADAGPNADAGPDAAPAQARGHAALLHEALANLLHNALLHAPRGGHVTVQAGVRGGQALLVVCDDGPGMPPQARARLGERFLHVPGAPARPGAPRGSGLGLAIAQAIAQRHGGALELHEARPGQPRPGLRATLHWPLAPAAQAAPGLPADQG